MENAITCVAGIVNRLAKDLSACDRQEIISAALVRIATGTEHALSAVRWSLADWLRDRVEVPQPTEDTELRRELQRARRTVRAASAGDLAKWDALLARMPERERAIAERLAAGYSMRDIAADLGIGLASADRARKAVRRMLGDSVLWSPILDALWGLPDSKIGRADWVTDLTEYRRQKRSAEHKNAPKVSGGTWTPRFTSWFVPFHAERSVVQWTIKSETPAPRPTRGAYAVILLPDESRKDSTVSVTGRELAGMERGERWTIDSSRFGPMVSSPVIRREFDSAGYVVPRVVR